MNQPIAAPELASAATTGAESLAMSSPSAFGDIFSTQPTHVVAMTGPAGHVPTPFITSATVAELKLVDNASPMPRDRIIFDYDMFNKVPLVAGGVGVNQYTAGFEKTLCDGRASVELRVPFATTLDANVDVGNTEGFGATNTHAVELGNVEIWTKALLYQDCTCAVSAGLGFVVPTASDSNVNMQDSLGGYVDVYRVVNRSTHLLPFVGCVWTPTERCFVQQFLQFDIDTIGNHVDVDNPNTGNLTSDGTLHSAPFVFYDISAGYWLWHEPPCSGRVVTGLAGIFEIHYNQALSHSNSVMIPSSAFFESDYHAIANTPYVDSIGDVMLGGDPAFSSVNLTFGLTAEICDDATLSAGYTLPVTQGIGKEFDGQLQVYFNYYFGRSSKSNRTGAASAPSTL
jgi:hypothetical protein